MARPKARARRKTTTQKRKATPKRRPTMKARTYKKRRISKPKTDVTTLLTHAVALGAGGFGVDMVIDKVSTMAGDKIPKAEIVIPGLIGVIATYMSSKQKKPGFLSKAFDGMAAVAMSNVISSMTAGKISGIGSNLDDVYFELSEGVNGIERQISQVSNPGMVQDLSDINGIERQISGSYFV